MTKTAAIGILAILGTLQGALPGMQAQAQDPEKPSEALPAPSREPRPSEARVWKEGVPIRIRVPLANESHEVLSAVSFPETGIQAAVTGWSQSTLTAIQKGGFLFLRLSRKSEGQLSVIGESGTHYLLYLESAEAQPSDAYDAFVKIVRPATDQGKPASRPREGAPERGKPRGALDLIRSMRLGDAREGARILRAKGEILYAGQDLELRLLFVYEEPSYVGRIYLVRNLSCRKLALDASRFRPAEGTLILSALRDNVISPGGDSRLYTVFWRP